MYKKCTLACLCCFVCLFASSQFEKGQKVLSGRLAFSSGKNDNVYIGATTSKFSHLTISPSLGWFIDPKQLFGIQLSFGSNYQKQVNGSDNSVQTTRDNSFAAGAFTERFIGLTKKVFFTINVSASAHVSKGKQTFSFPAFSSEAKSTGFGFGAGLAPGLSYRLSPRWLVDASLNNLFFLSYSRTVAKPAD
ncbi:MAG: hypothetical protein V4717_24415 [Bacteroidota bacterium]